MADTPPMQRLRPKRWSRIVLGLSLFAGGGCLMWTVVLIPIAIPIALVGLVLLIMAPFIKTEALTCPACGQADKVEPTVAVLVCPHCGIAIKRDGAGWARV